MHILVADDSKINLHMACGVLAQLGHTSDMAENGVQAVEMVRQKSFDGILMDCQMPEMDGFQATAAIRGMETARGTKPCLIIAITGDAEEAEKQRCINVGMNAVLKKPLRKTELQSALATVLDVPAAGKVSEANVVPPVPVEKKRERGPKFLELMPETGGTWDFEQLDQLAFGNADRMNTLSALFLRELKNGLGELEKAIEAGDLVESRRLSHRLAGSCATCGAEKIASSFRNLENAGADLTAARCRDIYLNCRQILVSMESDLAQQPWKK